MGNFGGGSRIILKSHYNKPSKNQGGGTSKYASYIATREGVVKYSESLKDEHVTDGQLKFIEQLTEDFPDTQKLGSYKNHLKSDTLGSAHEFIEEVLDEYGYEISGNDGYIQYMATRPGTVKVSDNGLFTDGNEPVDLEVVKDELKNYTGNVYMPIISLRAEDAHGYGYDNPQAWHELIERHRDEIAREYQIPPHHMRWYAAYHDAVNKEGVEHPHIHMVVFSTNPNEGWQSTLTGNKIRMILAKDIFSTELKEVYEKSTQTRDELRQAGYQKAEQLRRDIETNPLKIKPQIRKELTLLADELKNVKGRKYYAYLPKEMKDMVDNIMEDMVDSDPRMKELLEAWADTKDKQVKIYSQQDYQLPPIHTLKEFNPIKNKIISEAVKMNKGLSAKYIKTLTHEEYVAVREERATRAFTRSTASLLSSISRSTDKKQNVNHNQHITDAEKHDAEVRHSLGMK